MKVRNLLLLVFISLSIHSFAQNKPDLAKKIEQLAKKVVPYIHTEDVFLNTGRSLIATEDYNNVKKIVMSNGFPTINMVGKENSHKFWMLVQLCDFDIQMQLAVLKQMSRLVRKGEVIQEDFAMLTDRTRMNRGVAQLYGTQYVLDHDGVVMLFQIHDMNNVNDRRKSLGLSKLEQSPKPVIDTMTKKGVEETKYDDEPRSN
ncbi:MAG: hypothetical protein ACI8P3_003332 [Saprospiraceae bacterium]|jgi:hypothetical protein